MSDIAANTGRPLFAYWMFDRTLKIRPVAKELGCSHEQLRRACLPFGDPDWRPATEKLKQKVQAYTGGVVGLADWVPSPTQVLTDASQPDAAAQLPVSRGTAFAEVTP